uniref:Uncharacterized protein n=1 Tax=Anguilla anguilla TaxID=7936 RepID=A0A0E9PG97_ANGAN
MLMLLCPVHIPVVRMPSYTFGCIDICLCGRVLNCIFILTHTNTHSSVHTCMHVHTRLLEA